MDRTLREGVRALISGGVYQLDSDTLQNLKTLINKVLSERFSHDSDVIVHYYKSKPMISNGSYGFTPCGLFYHQDSHKVTVDRDRVTCKRCLASEDYRNPEKIYQQRRRERAYHGYPNTWLATETYCGRSVNLSRTTASVKNVTCKTCLKVISSARKDA